MESTPAFAAAGQQSHRGRVDVLREEAGCTAELDDTEQTSWLLFLKYLDNLEQERAMEAEPLGKSYEFLIDKPHRWSIWATQKKAAGGYNPDANLSLLNTFWALVLPGMANGFWIFLLKGFFNSLPQERYEATDGAGEWTKFWTITMSLSKPILAVLALGAFTTAYSEFMMGLVIIPDPDMWTLMIWLYELQIRAHPRVIYAILVIAAIPTMVIFMFCQNIIIRGIVVPVEK